MTDFIHDASAPSHNFRFESDANILHAQSPPRRTQQETHQSLNMVPHPLMDNHQALQSAANIFRETTPIERGGQTPETADGSRANEEVKYLKLFNRVKMNMEVLRRGTGKMTTKYTRRGDGPNPGDSAFKRLNKLQDRQHTFMTLPTGSSGLSEFKATEKQKILEKWARIVRDYHPHRSRTRESLTQSDIESLRGTISVAAQRRRPDEIMPGSALQDNSHPAPRNGGALNVVSHGPTDHQPSHRTTIILPQDDPVPTAVMTLSSSTKVAGPSHAKRRKTTHDNRDNVEASESSASFVANERSRKRPALSGSTRPDRPGRTSPVTVPATGEQVIGSNAPTSLQSSTAVSTIATPPSPTSANKEPASSRKSLIVILKIPPGHRSFFNLDTTSRDNDVIALVRERQVMPAPIATVSATDIQPDVFRVQEIPERLHLQHPNLPPQHISDQPQQITSRDVACPSGNIIAPVPFAHRDHVSEPQDESSSVASVGALINSSALVSSDPVARRDEATAQSSSVLDMTGTTPFDSNATLPHSLSAIGRSLKNEPILMPDRDENLEPTSHRNPSPSPQIPLATHEAQPEATFRMPQLQTMSTVAQIKELELLAQVAAAEEEASYHKQKKLKLRYEIYKLEQSQEQVAFVSTNVCHGLPSPE
jgi:hypothetical protein